MKKSGKKHLLLKILLPVFLVVALGLLLFKLTLGQIWKTYNYKDSLSLKHPLRWTILESVKTDVKYPYDEEYLFSITDASFEALKTDKAQVAASISITRMPKASVPGGMETLVSLKESRTAQNKKSPRKYFKIDNRPVIEYDIIPRERGSKTSFYWIDTENYIYFVNGDVLVDGSVLPKLYYELLVARTVNSLKFPK